MINIKMLNEKDNNNFGSFLKDKGVYYMVGILIGFWIAYPTHKSLEKDLDESRRAIDKKSETIRTLRQDIESSKIQGVASCDLNKDSYLDIIVGTLSGEKNIFLGKADGKYISLENYLSTKKDSIESRLSDLEK